MMHVYPNLYDALLQLRRLPSPDDYWIDSVCINQSDLERNQQVQMMGRIYGYAKLVTIWLGNCPLAFSSALAKLEQNNGLILPVENLDTIGDTGASYVTVAAGIYLLDRRYFSRLWVLQEICLSKKIELYLGENRISPETLLNIINLPPRVVRHSLIRHLHPCEFCPVVFSISFHSPSLSFLNF